MLSSLIILTYNQDKYVREAILGALWQDYSNYEIIISDDHSSDSTVLEIKRTLKEISSEIKVILNVNDRNLGLTGNLNKAISLSSGEIIVLCAGDDISLPSRISKSVELLERDKSATFASFAVQKIDGDGRLIESNKSEDKSGVLTLQDLTSGTALSSHGAARAYRRVVFQKFPEFNLDCPTEDSTGLLRALLIGYGLVSSEVAIKYRIHSTNLSAHGSIDRMNVDLISKQYHCDLDFARLNGLITPIQAELVAGWINLNHWRRVFKQKYNRGELSMKDWYEFLLLDFYSWREKMYYLRLIIQKKRLY